MNILFDVNEWLNSMITQPWFITLVAMIPTITVLATSISSLCKVIGNAKENAQTRLVQNKKITKQNEVIRLQQNENEKVKKAYASQTEIVNSLIDLVNQSAMSKAVKNKCVELKKQTQNTIIAFDETISQKINEIDLVEGLNKMPRAIANGKKVRVKLSKNSQKAMKNVVDTLYSIKENENAGK